MKLIQLFYYTEKASLPTFRTIFINPAEIASIEEDLNTMHIHSRVALRSGRELRVKQSISEITAALEESNGTL